jgi:hypothetical protein
VRRGRAHFNQVELDGDSEPDAIMLAAVDLDRGILVWEFSPADVRHDLRPQHRGYSHTLPRFPVDAPPSYLGDATLIPVDAFSESDWDGLAAENTNGLKKRVREMLESIEYI